MIYMADFSKIYEKLIDMGFPSSDVDAAINLGLFSFDEIFNELVDKEESSTMTKIFYQTSPKENTDISDTGVFAGTNTDDRYPLQTNTKTVARDSTILFDDIISRIQMSDRAQTPDQAKIVSVSTHTRSVSSTLSSSLLSSNLIDSSSKNMTRIQILDLLDPSYEPQTYCQPFLATMCSIRDLICWFCQARGSSARNVTQDAACNSRVAISVDTDMHCLIKLFENLKWHLVLPSGASSTRIYGKDYLDKFLDQLGLVHNAHLLAIVGCPQQRQREAPVNTVNLASATNNSQTAPTTTVASKDTCQVEVQMIDYRNNPLYVHGRSSFTDQYHLDTSTLQDVVTDFSDFCHLDLESFSLLQLDPGRIFSQPEDYLHSLRDLGFGQDVSLFCHSHMPAIDELDDIDGPVDSASFWYDDAGSHLDRNQSNEAPLFPGQGQVLQGQTTSRSVRDIWTDRAFCCVPFEVHAQDTQQHQKSLFRLCLAVLYHAVKVSHNAAVCRQVRRLPNHIQQILIRELVEEKSLTPSVLSHFCGASSCLTSLDLSYTVQATNEVLKCVSRCVRLQELILDNEDHVFNNDGLWHLRACLQLRRLSVNYCARISDWGLQVVAELPRLSVLSVKRTAVTCVGLKHLFLRLSAGDSLCLCPPLTSLDLSGLDLSDDCFQYLALFSRLEILNMAGTGITDPCLLAHLPELQHIDLSHCAALRWDSPSRVLALSHALPKLTSICVRGVSGRDLACLTQAVALCGNLRQVEGLLSHPQMTAGLLATVCHLPLDSIVVSGGTHVNDLWLPVLARFSASLSQLVLSSCHCVLGANDALLKNLGRLSHLSWLDLTHLENVDSAQIRQLVLGAHFPRMQVVWFSLTEAEELEFRCQAARVPFKVNITRSLPPHVVL